MACQEEGTGGAIRRGNSTSGTLALSAGLGTQAAWLQRLCFNRCTKWVCLLQTPPAHLIQPALLCLSNAEIAIMSHHPLLPRLAALPSLSLFLISSGQLYLTALRSHQKEAEGGGLQKTGCGEAHLDLHAGFSPCSPWQTRELLC